MKHLLPGGLLLALFSSCASTGEDPKPDPRPSTVLILGDWQSLSERTVVTFQDGRMPFDQTQTYEPGRYHMLFTTTTVQAFDNGGPGSPSVTGPAVGYSLNGGVLTSNYTPVRQDTIFELTESRLVFRRREATGTGQRTQLSTYAR